MRFHLPVCSPGALFMGVVFLLLSARASYAQVDPNKPGSFPRDAIIEVIPYLNYNNISGPYLGAQVYTRKVIYSGTFGTSYQDLLNSNRWNEYTVSGIKNFILKGEVNAMFILNMQEDDDRLKVKGARLGASHLSSFFHKKFNSADTFMTQSGDNPDQTYLYYNTNYVNTNYAYTVLNLGFGGQTSYYDIEEGKLMGHTREMYADVLVAAPSMLTYSHVNQDGTEFQGVSEPSFKTLVGGRVGVQWTSLRAVGWIVGMETGLRPGICHADSRYGPGTNVGAIKNYYFSMKLGMTAGVGMNVKR